MTSLRQLPPLAVAILTTAALMAGCATQDPATTAVTSQSQPSPSAPADTPVVPAPEATDAAGSYVEYADYLLDPDSFSSTDVVLFFHAPWCPSCRATEDDIEARRGSLPSGLTLVKVDFDSQQALRKTYGVTMQHTFVQIDADGAAIVTWNGSLTVDAIAAQIV